MPRKPIPPGCDHFQPGAAVEISSNDDGFRGSWFTGTVLRRGDSAASPSSRSKRQRTSTSIGAASAEKFWVQFDTIFNDEAGTSPVKELVHQHQLRPLVPKESRQKFSLNEEVDAFFNDGWWEGVVTEDLGDGKYELYFRASKESLQFEWKNLRLHREWTDNAWIPPFDKEQKASTTNEVKPDAPNTKKVKEKPAKAMPTNLKKGMLVEVSSDEDGYKGAWFLATIVKDIARGKYVIQYKHLRTDDDTDFVKEEIDAFHIRPCPPPVKMVKGFDILDEVDALYNDGWWVGVISAVLEGSKFKVFFRDTDEVLEFKVSELRLHQEWIDGNWVLSSST